MNLNANQLLAILIAVLGVFVSSTAQLSDLFGATTTHTIVSVSGLLMSLLSVVMGVLTGQGSQIRAVQAMPGIEKLVVNSQANQTLAQLAVDPAQNKIETKPQDASIVAQTAKGN